MNFLKFLKPILCLAVLLQVHTAIAQNDIVVLNLSDGVPSGAKKVGKIKIGDRMRLSCSYDQTLALALKDAREMGANLIKITSVKTPDALSTCYRIKADAYHAEDIQTIRAVINNYNDSLMQSLIPADAQYALLYIYRPANGIGPLISYNVHVGDSVYRLKYNTAYIAKLQKEGDLTVWARTESRDEETIKVEFGKVYFLKCTVKMGAFVGRPDLNIMDIRVGLPEFGKVRLITEPASSVDNTEEDDIYGETGSGEKN